MTTFKHMQIYNKLEGTDELNSPNQSTVDMQVDFPKL